MSYEIPFKRWLVEEAQRQGMTLSGIYRRWERGKYPGLKRRTVNARLVFVILPGNHPRSATQGGEGEANLPNSMQVRGETRRFCLCSRPAMKNSDRCQRCARIEDQRYAHANTFRAAGMAGGLTVHVLHAGGNVRSAELRPNT